jgi:hypothetical protein
MVNIAGEGKGFSTLSSSLPSVQKENPSELFQGLFFIRDKLHSIIITFLKFSTSPKLHLLFKFKQIKSSKSTLVLSP